LRAASVGERVLQPKEIVMFTVKQNAATTTLGVLVAFSLVAGSAAADTGPSSGLGAPAGLMGVAGTAVAAERDRLTDTTVQIRLVPVRGMGSGLADLIEQGDRTRVVVSMTSVPSDPANPSLIAEIHEGTCGDLGSAPLYAVENTLGGYPPAPYYVGGILPVSLSALRSGPYAISVRTGPEAGSVELACGNIAKSPARAVQRSPRAAIMPGSPMGEVVPLSGAMRTIPIDAKTKYVNVTAHETVKFVVNGNAFAMRFSGSSATTFAFVPSVVDLAQLAPAGVLDHKVTVYVAPDQLYISG